MRVLFRQESLPQSPVLLHSMPVNSPRSSSSSFTGDKFSRGKIASYGDGFAHVTLPLDRKWEINREHLRIEGELGVGAFGRVLQAAAVGVPGLKAKHTVAIKTLKGKICVTRQTDRPTHGRTHGRTDRPSDRPTERRTDWPTDEQTDGPANGRTDGWMDWSTDRQTDRQTHRQTTDRPTDGRTTNGLTDRVVRIDGLTDRLLLDKSYLSDKSYYLLRFIFRKCNGSGTGGLTFRNEHDEKNWKAQKYS